MKAIVAAGLLVIFAVAALPFLLGMVIRDVPNVSQPSLDFTEKVYGDFTVSQKFRADKNNLSIIGASIKNPNLKNKGDVLLSVLENDQLIRSAKVSGQVIPDGNFIKFGFAPIPDSAGKTYQLFFSSPATSREEPFEIFMTKDRPSWMEELLTTTGNNNGSISMVSFYKPESKFAVPLDIYRTWFNRLTADTVFSVFYTLALIAGVGYLLFPSRSRTMN